MEDSAVPRDVLLLSHNIVACTEHGVQQTLPVRTVFFEDIIVRWTQVGVGTFVAIQKLPLASCSEKSNFVLLY